MKISMFHLMPYRDLPADFEQRYHSVWVDAPYTELADSVKIGQYYNWTLDELIHAAKCGIDGICVNEHHQNAYGFMPNPDLMGRFWRAPPTGWIPRSCRWDRRCPLRIRRFGSPKNTR